MCSASHSSGEKSQKNLIHYTRDRPWTSLPIRGVNCLTTREPLSILKKLDILGHFSRSSGDEDSYVSGVFCFFFFKVGA